MIPLKRDKQLFDYGTAVVLPTALPRIVGDPVPQKCLVVPLHKRVFVGRGSMRIAKHKHVRKIADSPINMLLLPIKNIGWLRTLCVWIQEVPEMGIPVD